MQLREIGGYTLTRRLGVGGMGEVWQGQRGALGGASVEVAIKVLSPAKVNDPEARRMFLDEARLSMLLTSSNIVKVFDAAETPDETCYMVMEWVDGLDLSELSAKMRQAGEALPDDIIGYIIGEVLKGLAHAHDLRHGGERKTIVHRDVSPHNVMLSTSGEVKLMDFGIARVASEDTSGAHVKGKLRYMPPEQLRGETREPTLDLFAVGAMLHELLDGVKFRGKVVDEARLYGMILEGEVPPMTRAPSSIPHELDELRLGLLAANPANRVPSARAAFRQLTRWSGYRDARFEFDEIVRRYAGQESANVTMPATEVLAQPTTSAPLPAAIHPPPSSLPPSGAQNAGPNQAESAGSFIGARLDLAETTETALLPSEASDTDIARSSKGPTPTRETSTDRRKLAPVLLGTSAFVLGGLGVTTMVMSTRTSSESISAAVEISREVSGAQELVATDEPAPLIEEDDAEQLETARVEKADEAVEPDPGPAEHPEPVQVEESAPAEETKPVEPELEAAEEPEPAPAPKSRLKLTLDSGVRWAEVKVGSRKFTLDAFAKDTAKTRLAPGEYSASYRTKAGAPWKRADPISVSENSLSIAVGKGGLVVR